MQNTVPDTDGRTFDGGCHCGAIRFRAAGPLRQILICHCSDCLRITGTSWGATAVHQDNFVYLTDHRPRWYQSSQSAERGFCDRCGSQMLYRRHDAPLISIAPGALDDSDMLTVSGQIFASSHPAWGPLCSGLEDLDSGYPRK